MQLESRTLAHYLLARGGVARERVMSGDFVVVDVGRRNRNFKVLHRDGSGVFVKQARDGAPTARATLEREAQFYAVLARSPAFEELRSLSSRSLAWDAHAGVLIIELLRSGRSWQDLQSPRLELSVEWAAAVGRRVARLHASGARALNQAASQLAWLPRTAPWIFSFADGRSQAPGLSRAHAQLAQRVRAVPALAHALAGMRRGWAKSTLIHGDMKWDNVMLFSPEQPAEAPRIVDWELVDVGDPAWDLAGLLQSFLIHWLGRFPDLTGRSFEALSAEQPGVAGLDQAVGALLLSYRAETPGIASWGGPLVAQAWHAFIERVVRFVGARLLQTVYELEAASQTLSSRSCAVIDLCTSLLSRPEVALRVLFRGAT